MCVSCVLSVICAGEDSISSRAVDVYEVELEKPLAIGTLPSHGFHQFSVDM